MCVLLLVQIININLYNGRTFIVVFVFKFRGRRSSVAATSSGRFNPRKVIFFIHKTFGRALCSGVHQKAR